MVHPFKEALHLAAIVESSDDAIVSKDLNGIITSWNHAAEVMFGYSADEVIGKSIRIVIPDDRQSEEDQVLAAIRRGDRVDHFETIRQRKDGTLFPISLTVSPIRDTDGHVIGASKIARDVSDRKRAEQERDRLSQALQQANRMKDDFLATLSHELRTPLNAILGYARMLRLGLLTPERQGHAVQTIERNAASLSKIVEDVLDVSRIVSGKMRLKFQLVDAGVVVCDAIEAIRPAADAKGIAVEIAVDTDVSPVLADSDRLQQIIWNLLSNAVKFTGRGGQIRVALIETDDHVELVVSDTGIGIRAEFLPHVFDRFRQAESGMNRESGGLGLGLSIARELIQLHGGTIEAFSDGPGQGATFKVTLPAAAQRANAPMPPELQDPLLRRPVDLHGVRVLAVDDEVDALGLVCDILERAGAEVVAAHSGAEALEMIERCKPDVLITDLGMPRMDGFELLGRIRQTTDDAVRNVPAAALTAFARSEDTARAHSSGFQMHLAKPIDPSALTSAIASLAGRPT